MTRDDPNTLAALATLIPLAVALGYWWHGKRRTAMRIGLAVRRLVQQHGYCSWTAAKCANGRITAIQPTAATLSGPHVEVVLARLALFGTLSDSSHSWPYDILRRVVAFDTTEGSELDCLIQANGGYTVAVQGWLLQVEFPAKRHIDELV